MPTEFKLKPDRRAAFVAEALRLRALYVYREANDRAQHYPAAILAEVLADPEPVKGPDPLPSFDDLSTKYDQLMGEWCDVPLEAVHGVVAYAEFVLEIIAGALVAPYREAGNIVMPERDLGYALDLQRRVRNWLNNLAIEDAIQQERAFYAAHPRTRASEPLSEAVKAELRSRAKALAADYNAPLPEGEARLIEAERRMRDYEPRRKALYNDFAISPEIEAELIEPTVTAAVNRLCCFIEETTPSSLAGALVKLRHLADPRNGLLTNRSEIIAEQLLEFFEQTTDRVGSEWPTLHRRWAEITARIAAMDAEIDNLEGKPKRSKALDNALSRLREDRDRLIDTELDEVLNKIFDEPADNWEAVATLVDIALENESIEPPENLGDWVAFTKVLKALRYQAPAIEFTSLRRYYGPSVDVEAIIAKA